VLRVRNKIYYEFVIHSRPWLSYDRAMLAYPRWRAGLLAAAAVLLAGPGLACSSARTPAPGAGPGSRPGSSPGSSPNSSTGRTASPSASGVGERPTSLPYLEQ